MQSVQSTQPADPASDQTQPQPSQPLTIYRPKLKALPRGRPPKSKTAPRPRNPPWQHGPQQQAVCAAEPASAAPIINTPPPLTQAQRERARDIPEAAYVRGGHLLGGYNSARYSGNPAAHPKFNPEGRLCLLTNASSLEPWVQQISYIARSMSCFDELTKRFASFPQPCTVQLFICETRFATTFRVLEGSISGPVWAYMRVLGYSSIQPNGQGLMCPTPADCFEYAKLAASKMDVPGNPEQPAEERERMVREVLTAHASEYPSDRVYKKGMQWLRLACDNLIRQGDHALAKSLYDPLRDWAPKPPGYEEPPAPPTASGQQPSPEEDAHHATPAGKVANSPAPNGSATTPAAPIPPKPVPEGQKSNKRKRAGKEVGPKANKASKPSAGSEAVA